MSENTTPRHAEAPTQVQNPGRAVVRTVFAAIVGLAVLSPAITPGLVDWARENAGILPEWVVPTVVAVNAAVVAAAALITRILAVPGVNAWLEKYIPILGASK